MLVLDTRGIHQRKVTVSFSCLKSSELTIIVLSSCLNSSELTTIVLSSCLNSTELSLFYPVV